MLPFFQALSGNIVILGMIQYPDQNLRYFALSHIQGCQNDDDANMLVKVSWRRQVSHFLKTVFSGGAFTNV
jgi:hypothetical protein